MVYKGAQEWYHDMVTQVNERSSSRLLCQVVVLNAMKPRRLSPRVILQISIWTLVVIVLAFILLYSFLLTYMNRHVLQPSHVQNGNSLYWENTPKLKDSQNLHKVKFQSKGIGNYRLHNTLENENKDTLVFDARNNAHRKVLWNSTEYYDVFSAPPTCHSNTSLLTILITSSPDHIEQRSQIRQTWCNSSALAQPKGTWQCVFLIGQTSSWEVDNAVDQEAEQFHDILRGAYIDSYRNLTLKVLHGLNWSSRVCPTSYTLKTDDDCFVNVLQLLLFLKESNKVKTNLYVGSVVYILQKRKVIRNKMNKWSVPESLYSQEYYPPYASGTGYVLSRDMVQAIVVESQYITPIPNEDAFVGIVADSLGVQPVSSSRFTLFSVGLRLCNYLYVFVSHDVKPEDQHSHYNSMVEASSQCRADADTLTSWS